jgi:hypothetical protein
LSFLAHTQNMATQEAHGRGGGGAKEENKTKVEKEHQ